MISAGLERWRLTMWFALLAGLFEASIVAGSQLSRLSAQTVWMAPAANLGLYAVLSGLLWLVGRWWKPAVRPDVAVASLSFVALAGILSMAPGRLHHVAVPLLAAGVAWQLRRAVLRRTHAFAQLVRRTTWWLVGLVVFLAGAVNLERWMVERQALSGLPAAPADAPNILLLILDTVRAKSLSLYGYPRPTSPELDRWASHGVVFQRAIATAPWTLPSHAGMFTGRFHHEVSANWVHPLEDVHPTLAEELAARGYVTAGFVANLLYCIRTYGLDRGFGRYEDHPISIGQLILSSAVGRAVVSSDGLRRWLNWHEVLNRKNAARINDDFLTWLDAQEAGRPFFAFLNYFDAHEPLLPPDSIRAHFGPARAADARFEHVATVTQGNHVERAAKWDLTPGEASAEQAAYDGAIAYLDREIGGLLAELDRRGVLENTVVIVTSDHGEQLGEHNLWSHLNSLYLELLHVPLVIIAPERVPAEATVDATSTLGELPATVMDLAGFGTAHPFPGRSLARHWSNERAPRDAVLPALSAVTPGLVHQPWYPIAGGLGRSLVTDSYHYIRYGADSVELYNLEVDANEQVDLSQTAAGARRADSLRVVVDSLMRRH